MADYQCQSMRMLSIGLENSEVVIPKDMTDLNFIETRLLPVESILNGLDLVLHGLEEMFSKWLARDGSGHAAIQQDWAEMLGNQRKKTAAYRNYSHILLQKCSSSSKLLEGIMDFHSQAIARQQSSHVLFLTTATVDDSTTVRVITAITLAFLSFTAVAVRPSHSHLI